VEQSGQNPFDFLEEINFVTRSAGITSPAPGLLCTTVALPSLLIELSVHFELQRFLRQLQP
jgi:hypothetical protein